MSRYRKIINKALASLLLVLIISFNNAAFAADGEALFKANCGNCHKPDADYTGPALKGWSTRVPDAEWIYKWVANPAQMIASDAYAKALFEKWKPTVMTAFSNLKKDEVDAIMKYVDDYTPPAAPTGAGATANAPETDNSLLFGILTLVLAVVAFILLQVNSN
ncbi:MAG: cytochrome c, partial [Ferruginibacter sp.]